MDISDDGKAAVCRFGHERSDMSDGGKLQCLSGQCYRSRHERVDMSGGAKSAV